MFSDLYLPLNLTLRPAEPDAPALRRLAHAAERWDLAQLGRDAEAIRPRIERDDRARAEAAAGDRPAPRHYLIERAGAAAGRLIVRHDGALELLELTLLPEARAAGAGEAVVQGLQRAAAETAQPLALALHCLNTEALDACRELGFVATDADVGPTHLELRWQPR